jgi:hypothetical protein
MLMTSHHPPANKAFFDVLVDCLGRGSVPPLSAISGYPFAMAIAGPTGPGPAYLPFFRSQFVFVVVATIVYVRLIRVVAPGILPPVSGNRQDRS